MPVLDEDSFRCGLIAGLLQRNTTDAYAEALLIAISACTNEDGQLVVLQLDPDFEKSITYAKQVARLVRRAKHQNEKEEVHLRDCISVATKNDGSSIRFTACADEMPVKPDLLLANGRTESQQCEFDLHARLQEWIEKHRNNHA